jgi:hypothetical protein
LTVPQLEVFIENINEFHPTDQSTYTDSKSQSQLIKDSFVLGLRFSYTLINHLNIVSSIETKTGNYPDYTQFGIGLNYKL